MIEIGKHSQGVVLPVRARPGAKVNRFLDEHNQALRVAVTAPPDKGRANEAIVQLLAEKLNLRRSQIQLLTGPTAREKRFLIEGLSAAELLERIEAVLRPVTSPPPKAGPSSS